MKLITIAALGLAALPVASLAAQTPPWQQKWRQAAEQKRERAHDAQRRTPPWQQKWHEAAALKREEAHRPPAPTPPWQRKWHEAAANKAHPPRR